MQAFISFLLLLCLLLCQTSFASQEYDLRISSRGSWVPKLGDFGQFIPSLAGLFIATSKKDMEGANQLIAETIINTMSAYSVKFAFRNTYLGQRPDGDMMSFYSGHTSIAFQGSFFILHRYGIKFGIPMLSISTIVGLTRVHAFKHYFHDTVFGAISAYIFSHLITTKFQDEKDQSAYIKFTNKGAMISFRANF